MWNTYILRNCENTGVPTYLSGVWTVIVPRKGVFVSRVTPSSVERNVNVAWCRDTRTTDTSQWRVGWISDSADRHSLRLFICHLQSRPKNPTLQAEIRNKLSTYVQWKCVYIIKISLFGSTKEWDRRNWRKLHNEERHNLYVLPYVIPVIKSKRKRQVGHVAHEKWNAYKVLVGKL
jgi:hypothetical protein